MKEIILDLTDCKYLGELHERIRVAFDFPEWYGANWSAFWDLLWSECDADEVSVQGEHSLPKEFDKDNAFWDLLRSECNAEALEIIGIDTLPKEFDAQIELMKRVLEMFKNNCKKYDEIFEYTIS